MTDRLSLRAWLAALLVISAALFFVGIYLERGVIAPLEPAAVQPSSPAHVEAEGGEAGPSEAPAASAAVAGESAAQHAAETWPLGIDLEAPSLVGGAIVVSLLLAFAVLGTTGVLVLAVVVGFSLLFAVLDLIELSHQLGVSRTGLAAVAAVLLILHAAAALVALRLRMSQQRAVVAGR